ncbi:hypothetical protein V1512DRAFT_264857 [Lipomyces arxii]|uniref:uncharacterized protein n=1 Tax=Lipomyces arxii TaxID=56418 RepID=UPI0034CDB881
MSSTTRPKLLYPIHDYPAYQPIDVLTMTSKAVLPSYGMGLVYSATIERVKHFQAPLVPSVIRIGRHSFFLGTLGCGFVFAEGAITNLREKGDGYNDFIAGALTGAVAAIPRKLLLELYDWF